MVMVGSMRKVDAKGRVILPDKFAGQTVHVLEAGGEVRIKIVRPLRRRPSLESLMSRVTEGNHHGEVDFGPPVGDEQL
jgi:antitoxin component of MazEF toxin-antitoxin module